MIIIDMNQISLASLMMDLNMRKSNEVDEGMVRHMILNSIRGYVHRFRNDYPGEVVICVDGPDPWRRDIFEQYKAKRREGRNNDDKDQLRIPVTELFDILDENKADAREYFRKIDERQK